MKEIALSVAIATNPIHDPIGAINYSCTQPAVKYIYGILIKD